MSGSNNETSALFPVLVLALLAGIGYLVYRNFEYLAFLWKWMRLIELAPFYWVPEGTPIYGDLRIAEAVRFLWRTPYDLIAPETIRHFDAVYPKWFRWLPAIGVIYLGVRKIRTTTKINDRFDEETLLQRLAPIYPHLKKYVSVNPNDKPSVFKRGSRDAYVYSGAVSEELFATLTPPLLLEKAAKGDSSIAAPIWDGDCGFDYNLAERAFEAQLDIGGVWFDVEELAPLERRIYNTLEQLVPLSEDADLKAVSEHFRLAVQDAESGLEFDAASLPYGDRQIRKACQDQVGAQLARSGLRRLLAKDRSAAFTHLRRLGREYDFLIRFYQEGSVKAAIRAKRAREIMSRHGFVHTGLMSLLEASRETGKVSVSVTFDYVKEVNRTLWYALQSAGKRVAFWEAAGIAGHWRAEMMIGRPLSTPSVQEAVIALQTALKLEDRLKLKRRQSGGESKKKAAARAQARRSSAPPDAAKGAALRKKRFLDF